MIGENLIRPCIVVNAGHLPGNFHSRLVGLDCETIVVDLAQHDRLRELANYGELVADVATRRVEVGGQIDVREALVICNYITVADARHGMRFGK